MIPSDFSAFLAHSPLNVIIITWVLTAFLPLPLVILIITFRYFPGSTSRAFTLCSSARRRQTSLSSGPSTPSSKTLTVTNGSPNATQNVDIQSGTPPNNNGFRSIFLSPNTSTPRNSVTRTSGDTAWPSAGTTGPRSGSKLRKDITHDSPPRLSPAFESPTRLNFLEPLNLPTTPTRQSKYRRLSEPAPGPDVLTLTALPPIEEEPRAAPHSTKRHRLKRRSIISAVLFSIVLALYILEGFAVLAAQNYAHARILLLPDGSGGVGKGKENEKWIAPWAIYVLVQGGLVMYCAWLVWTMRCEAKRSAQDWAKKTDQGKDVRERLGENGNGDIELGVLRSKNNGKGEGDAFLAGDKDGAADGNIFDDGNIPDTQKDEQEEDVEPDWRTLGFRPTYPPQNATPSSSKRTLQDPEWEDPNPFGEGSSSTAFDTPESSARKWRHHTASPLFSDPDRPSWFEPVDDVESPEQGTEGREGVRDPYTSLTQQEEEELYAPPTPPMGATGAAGRKNSWDLDQREVILPPLPTRK
ncbi:MAG: hypothetical protein Q9174_004265, partial [Haloplaca sp. 1 TL-2023]